MDDGGMDRLGKEMVMGLRACYICVRRLAWGGGGCIGWNQMDRQG